MSTVFDMIDLLSKQRLKPEPILVLLFLGLCNKMCFGPENEKQISSARLKLINHF